MATCELTTQETKLFLINQKTFREFPRGTQVTLEYNEVPEFGTVVGHRLNCMNEMVLEISVIGQGPEYLVTLHPTSQMHRVIKM